ncbi:MAG: aldo/keto reductase [Gemmatimonadota bacterium]|nr:MAG: aldo/keto reductase [Gemmatimonadota bacterium]
MRMRPLGPAAPQVSAIGFGGMPLSIQDRPDERQAVDVIHAALGAGMTLIDTADVYCLDDNDIGHNERLIAKALSSWPTSRDSIIVATKGGMIRPDGRWQRRGSPEHLAAACDRSLRALGVERIDLYQFHAPDTAVPFEDSVAALAALREEGKIRWVGLSNVSVAQIQAAQAIVEVTTVQNRLSPFFREALETGVVKYCRENGIGFLAYSPVGGGRLNKKLPAHPEARSIGDRHKVSAHAVVLAWVLARAPNVIAIPGARTVAHALDSAAAAELVLEPEELEVIDRADFSTA